MPPAKSLLKVIRVPVIHPLLYLDDIRLYARSERDIDSLIHITRIYSKGIRMSFGQEKCCWMIPKRGKMIRTEGAELSEGNKADVHSYKYLGVPQANGNHKEVTRKDNPQRVRQAWKSQLNGKNKVRAINSYTMLVIR